MMDFYAMVEQVLILLRSRGRVPYRALKLQLIDLLERVALRFEREEVMPAVRGLYYVPRTLIRSHMEQRVSKTHMRADRHTLLRPSNCCRPGRRSSQAQRCG